MRKITFHHSYQYIISVDNLLAAWQEFVRGKRARRDVQEFERDLMGNILALHKDLADKTYYHSLYHAFNISDPKPRSIHKASVRDRLLHHALYRILYPFFDKTFIADSYSCRVDKGTHKAIRRFATVARKVSKNNTNTCWVLKCDIKKFFASIDHHVLKSISAGYIEDQSILWLLARVIDSFTTQGRNGVGLPLGNPTSQLFVNVYMNEFDQFVKHKLKTKYYIRYADDFVLFSHDREWLSGQVPRIASFLENKLKLSLHGDKVFIKTLASGIDFLGWVHFPDHRVLRTATKRRMMNRIKQRENIQSLNSYLGLLSHGNTHKLQEVVLRHQFS